MSLCLYSQLVYDYIARYDYRFLIYEKMRKYFTIYEEAFIVIYDFATAPLWISLYMRKIWFSFLLVYITCRITKLTPKLQGHM
jgi:hypothetical protein